MHANRVPLTISGMDVGSARINEDGTIELIMKSPCPIGVELLGEIVSGFVDGLSIEPITTPAVDANVIDIKRASSGIQIGNGNNQSNHFR